MDRLLRESDVIKVINEHTNDGKFDKDIRCILENIETASIDIPPLMLNAESSEACDESPRPRKEKRVQLFENNNLILDHRGNKYYLSFFDDDGKFRREVTIILKDDYKVALSNGQ
uniref:hypothetical protein n=1 Tax=Coprococcus catus TaxID=116085 RepID=UPI0022E0E538|nr:hypothetical protein [Coprococcus catus]